MKRLLIGSLTLLALASGAKLYPAKAGHYDVTPGQGGTNTVRSDITNRSLTGHYIVGNQIHSDLQDRDPGPQDDKRIVTGKITVTWVPAYPNEVSNGGWIDGALEHEGAASASASDAMPSAGSAQATSNVFVKTMDYPYTNWSPRASAGPGKLTDTWVRPAAGDMSIIPSSSPAQPSSRATRLSCRP